MAGEFRQGHYLLGIEGLALLRAGARRSFEDVETRTEEIREILARLDEPPYAERRDLPEVDVDAGYAEWAEGYDEPGNDTIAAEEPVVRALLNQLPAGPVLDAACGPRTGAGGTVDRLQPPPVRHGDPRLEGRVRRWGRPTLDDPRAPPPARRLHRGVRCRRARRPPLHRTATERGAGAGPRKEAPSWRIRGCSRWRAGRNRVGGRTAVTSAFQDFPRFSFRKLLNQPQTAAKGSGRIILAWRRDRLSWAALTSMNP